MHHRNNSHSVLMGYLLWFFGFLGAHRFYYGKKLTGIVWFFTLGLLFVGWIVDLFLIPAMDREADQHYLEGPYDYNVAWVLLTFLGVFGLHRMYLGRWFSGVCYLITLGFLGVGVVLDFLKLNELVAQGNRQVPARYAMHY